MPQTKFNCPSCRRLIPINSEYCPNCSKKIVSKAESENLKKDTPQKESSLVQEDILLDEPEETVSETNVFQNSSKKIESEDIPDDLFDDESSNDLENFDFSEEPNKVDILSGNTEERSPIVWTDEEKKKEPDHTKMYVNNQYNANFDGAYDDVLPKIQNEVENLLQGKEKTVMKIIFSIVGIIGVIIYLIITI